MKISTFIIALVLIGAFVGTLATFYAGVADSYSKTYDETTWDSYNKLANIQNTTQSVYDQIEDDANSDPSLTDLVGGFLRNGFSALKLTFQSFGLFNEMSDDAFNKIGVRTGASFTLWQVAIPLIVFILFIFAIITVLVGRET